MTTLNAPLAVINLHGEPFIGIFPEDHPDMIGLVDDAFLKAVEDEEAEWNGIHPSRVSGFTVYAYDDFEAARAALTTIQRFNSEMYAAAQEIAGVGYLSVAEEDLLDPHGTFVLIDDRIRRGSEHTRIETSMGQEFDNSNDREAFLEERSMTPGL